MLLQNILYSIINNLFKSGLIIAISLTLLENIRKNIKYVGFFSFISGSFFIVKLFQYNIVSKSNISGESFLKHSIIGGVAWCLYAILMYVLFKLNYSPKQIIGITALVVLATSIFYFYFASQNYFNLF